MNPEVRFGIMTHMLRYALCEFEERDGRGFFNSLAYEHMRDNLNFDLTVLRELWIKGFPDYPTDVAITKPPQNEEETMIHMLNLIKKTYTSYKENDIRGTLTGIVATKYLLSVLVKFEKAYKK